jgi:hypothetical protein
MPEEAAALGLPLTARRTRQGRRCAGRLLKAAKVSSPVLLFIVAGCNRSSPPFEQGEQPKPPLGVPSGFPSSRVPLSLAPEATAIPLGPIRMGFATQVGATAVRDSRDAQTSARRCRVHSPCKPFVPLGQCPKDIRPIDASELAAFVPAALGERLSVRGRLGIGPGISTNGKCRQDAGDLKNCCNAKSLRVFVGGIPDGARLEGMTCGGDESRVCCEVPAFGQVVVATGKVMKETESMIVSRGGRWSLSDVTLCSEEPTHAGSRAPQGARTSRP